MSEGIGLIIVIAIIAFLIWLLGKIISIALFVVVAVPLYIVLGSYATVKFIAMNIFIGLDKLFYLGFNVPVVVVWVFWGLVIGAAIQGYREMRIYGRKRIQVLIAVAPILLLVLAAGIRSLPSLLISDTPTPTVRTENGTDKQEPGVEVKANATPHLASVPEGMVLIPAGEFTMGSEANPAANNPAHTVYVDAFYMDTYEVTNAQYAAFLNVVGGDTAVNYYLGTYWQQDGTNVPESDMMRIKYIDGHYQVKQGYENHPVHGVTWYGAMAYAAWARKRLPTEAEWEKAARSGLVGKAYPWGDTIDDDQANYNQNATENVGKTTSIGSYPANSYGLYDMAGNVSEWCLDEYHKDFNITSPRENPIVGGSLTSILTNWANIETARVIRGGSWTSDTDALRCDFRYYSNPRGDRVTLFSGFRCVTGVSSSDKE